MKKLLLFPILFLLPLFVIAQTELTGALGLTFGMNKASVKKIMIDKGGVLNEGSDSNALSYSSVTMGTKKPDRVTCMFINDKLYAISILFIPVTELSTQGVFDDLQAIVSSKYGEPKSIREFRNSYKDGDGREMIAVSTGNATINSQWRDFKNNSLIALEIASLNMEVFVVLTYVDGILAKEVNAKNADDF